jgi:hypothetical protein
MTAAGHPRAIFERAIERRNLVVAEAMVREIGRVSLEEALELTALIALEQPHRHERAALRWLRLYLDEHRPSLEELAWRVTCLKQLGGSHHDAALAALRTVDSANAPVARRARAGVARR